MDDSIPLNFHKCAQGELENSPKVILFEKCKKMTSDLHSAKLEYVKRRAILLFRENENRKLDELEERERIENIKKTPIKLPNIKLPKAKTNKPEKTEIKEIKPKTEKFVSKIKDSYKPPTYCKHLGKKMVSERDLKGNDWSYNFDDRDAGDWESHYANGW